MKLSVVVPVYNGAPTLDRCLAALCAALPPDSEVVVVDDASTDDSAAIAARHPVRLVRRANNGGASAARNHGVSVSDAELFAFVDADVVVRPDALTRLVAALDDDTLGANGLFALDLSTPGLVTAFTNTSIHYQHLRHGKRVASAFTGLCVLRRAALARMGGWDERTSRFADDVGTRWHLPPGSLALVPEAQGEHVKAVRLLGLLKHRAQIGRHFVDSVLDNWGEAKERPRAALLDLRYPLNTLAAGLTVVLLPFGRPTWFVVPLGILVVANADFVRFTLRHRGPVEALAALPISALEGYAYGAGLAAGLLTRSRRSRVRAPAAAR